MCLELWVWLLMTAAFWLLKEARKYQDFIENTFWESHRAVQGMIVISAHLIVCFDSDSILSFYYFQKVDAAIGIVFSPRTSFERIKRRWLRPVEI